MGTRIDDEGVLLREGGEVFFRRDAGGRYRLDMRRVTLDLISGRIRILGVYVGDDLIDVDELRLL